MVPSELQLTTAAIEGDSPKQVEGLDPSQVAFPPNVGIPGLDEDESNSEQPTISSCLANEPLVVFDQDYFTQRTLLMSKCVPPWVDKNVSAPVIEGLHEFLRLTQVSQFQVVNGVSFPDVACCEAMCKTLRELEGQFPLEYH